jgi:hypothetical protein
MLTSKMSSDMNSVHIMEWFAKRNDFLSEFATFYIVKTSGQQYPLSYLGEREAQCYEIHINENL